jgi:hypothetical protein
MPKSTFLNNAILALLFQGTTITGLAQNATTSPLTVLYVSLHTAAPGVGGAQNVSEAAYPGYARVAVARTSSGWTVPTAGSVSPVANINFPAATGGSETETYFAIGTTASGAGTVLYSGPITPNLSVSTNVQPFLNTATSISEA